MIVLEALDGVGKTTACAGLAAALGAEARDTPGAGLRPLRSKILAALGPDQAARALFYASTVRAEGVKAGTLVAGGRTVVMDRYWLSTRAYAIARGADLPWAALEGALVPPTVTFLLHLDEDERRRRLVERGCTEADLETLDGAFCSRVRAAWLSSDVGDAFRPRVIDVTGLGPAAVTARLLAELVQLGLLTAPPSPESSPAARR